MGFEKGVSGNKNGRPKGAPNYFTQNIRNEIFKVYKKMGGAKGLHAWAKKNPDSFYKELCKLIPKDVVLDGSLDVKFKWEGENGEDNNGPV